MIADPTHIVPIPGFGEPVSAVSHLAAAAVFTFLSVDLIRRGHGEPGRVFALSIYAFAVIFQLVVSGVCHMLPPGSAANRLLLQIDHAAIFFLIAATFTPIHGILFRGISRWGPLVFFWTAALAGIILRTFFAADVSLALGASLYVGLGWAGLFTGALTWRHHGFRFMAPLFCGGLIFTGGLLVEWAMAKPVVLQWISGVFGGHEFFHFAVIAGISINWAFIYRIADGRLAEERIGDDALSDSHIPS